MKTRIGLVANVLAIAVVLGMGGLAEAKTSGGIALAALAGNWAGEGSSTFSVCFNSDFSAVVDCSGAPHVVFFNQTFVSQGTIDKNGNACLTIPVTNSPEFPNPAAPAHAFTLIETVKTTSYNPTTETGETSFTTYNAGPGISCKGSVLVNTSDEAEAGNGTSSFVVSQKGSRIDSVVDTAVNSPISDLDNYVGHAVSFKQ